MLRLSWKHPVLFLTKMVAVTDAHCKVQETSLQVVRDGDEHSTCSAFQLLHCKLSSTLENFHELYIAFKII